MTAPRSEPCYNGEMFLVKGSSMRMMTVGCLALSLSGCVHQGHDRRVDTVKQHVEAFYQALEGDRVSDAVRENERIEALGRHVQEGILQRAGGMDPDEKAREWSLVKAAKEAAAENWLALAQYFLTKREYDRARGTYLRVTQNYDVGPYQPFADRARAGLRAVDSLSGSTHAR